MDATIITIGDVFKKTVQDSIKIPTIWMDVNGRVQIDRGYHAIVEASNEYRPEVYSYPARDDVDTQFYLERESKKYREGNYDTAVIFKGDLLQIGPHVFSCGPAIKDPNSVPIKRFDITKIFVHAKNLVNLSSTFDSASELILSKMSSSLFSSCPNLVRLNSVFAFSELKKIPAGLFDKNLNLKYLDQTFMSCKKLTEIPEGLFKNNEKIKSFRNCFLFSGITHVPEGLLKHLDPNCEFDSMFSGTPFASNLFVEQGLSLEQIRDLYFPDQTPLDEIQKAL